MRKLKQTKHELLLLLSPLLVLCLVRVAQHWSVIHISPRTGASSQVALKSLSNALKQYPQSNTFVLTWDIRGIGEQATAHVKWVYRRSAGTLEIDDAADFSYLMDFTESECIAGQTISGLRDDVIHEATKDGDFDIAEGWKRYGCKVTARQRQ